MELDSSFVKTFSQDLQNCRDLFAALGDEVRQQILLALTHSTVPGMRVGEITAKTKLSDLLFPSYPHFKKCRDYSSNFLFPSG